MQHCSTDLIVAYIIVANGAVEALDEPAFIQLSLGARQNSILGEFHVR